MLRSRHFLLAGLITALFHQPGSTAEDWSLCRIPSFNFLETENLAGDETLIEAQTLLSEDSESIHLSGDVSLTRERQRINADDILFDKSTEKISARGNVVFADPNYRLWSPQIWIDNQNDSALFEQPEFELQNQHARGQADKIEKLDPYRSLYSDLTYTSCDPDDSVWHLAASELEINTETGRGTAIHATLYFRQVPFLYLPYFQFPIDDRRVSGILTPSIGFDESNGTTVVLPVYWNIAPNYDMTITPVYFSDRGLQLNTENRYLLKNNQGQLDLSYLDDDEVDDSRRFQQWHHKARFSDRVKAELLLVEVSDRDFFDDFKNVAPEYNNTRHLERCISFSGNGEVWHSELLFQDYQTPDEDTVIGNRPYNSLPRLSLEANPEPWIEALQTPLQMEWVRFDRDDSVTGNRAHIVSSVNWRAAESWYFFEPRLQLAFTDYRLDNNPNGNSIARALPTLSLDSGLIFERQAGSGNQWLQTLEPRLYFLHTPFEDQDDIPDFDTSLNSRTYSNLFTNNRFTGADRIGDANQVTFGLTSRIFDNDNGAELLRARIGQIFFFEDRRVSLDGVVDEDSKSDLISELDIWPYPGLGLSARLVYDQDQSELSERNLSISYSNRGVAANFGYYFSEDEIEQALLSVVYPVNERWAVVAKYHRSLLFDQPVEHLLGLNYESCCWGLKILAGQTGDEIDDFAETDSSIYFEFTFKGLSQAGQDVDRQLQDAIPGYYPKF